MNNKPFHLNGFHEQTVFAESMVAFADAGAFGELSRSNTRFDACLKTKPKSECESARTSETIQIAANYAQAQMAVCESKSEDFKMQTYFGISLLLVVAIGNLIGEFIDLKLRRRNRNKQDGESS
jgi:hypothetical protein